MATIEFHGADLVVYFNSNPLNRGVDHYLIEYKCKTGTVSHRVDQAAHQSEASDGTRYYQDTLTYAENEGAGLTRNVRVSVRAVGDGSMSVPDVEDAQNSLPVLPSAPTITSTLTGVEIAVPAPTDGDLEGYVAWVGTRADFPLNSSTERYRGAANAVSLQLPTDDTYFVRIAPYDAFGLDTFSAWDAQQIKRGDLNAAIGATPVVQSFQQAQAAIDNAVGKAQSDATKAQTDATKAQNDLAAAKVDLSADIAAAKKAGDDASAQAAQVRADLVPTITAAKKAGDDASAAAQQVRTDLVPTIDAAKKAGTDAAAQASQISTDLANEVSRAKGAEGTLTTKVETAQQTADGAVTSISTETTQRTQGDTALGQRIDTVVSTANTDRSNNEAAIRDERTTRASDVAAVANRTTDLEARAQGGGNFITNTTFTGDDYSGWTLFGNGHIDNVGVNIPRDDNWHPKGENVLTLHQGDRNNSTGLASGGGWRSSPITVAENQHYQFYALVAAHRAQVELSVQWFNASGNEIGSTYTGPQGAASGGRNIADYTQHGFRNLVAPSGATYAVFSITKWDTNANEGDSWMWFLRPYASAVRADQQTWNPYVAGDASAAVRSTTLARISEEATASSNRDSALGQRIDSVVTQANTDRADYTSKINSEATSRSDAVGAVGRRVDEVVTQANTDRGNLNTRITNEATASANRDAAIGSRTQLLESTAARLNDMALKSFPGFEVQADGWGYDTQLRGRNSGSAWETHHTKGAGIAFPPGFGNYLYMDPLAWIKTTPDKRYRAGFWVWQWSAPNGYGGNARVYYEGQNKDHTDSSYLGITANAPETQRNFYEAIPNGAWHLYAFDYQVDDTTVSTANSYWIRRKRPVFSTLLTR